MHLGSREVLLALLGMQRRKRVPTGADTRLITPYTSYLLRGFQR